MSDFLSISVFRKLLTLTKFVFIHSHSLNTFAYYIFVDDDEDDDSSSRRTRRGRAADEDEEDTGPARTSARSAVSVTTSRKSVVMGATMKAMNEARRSMLIHSFVHFFVFFHLFICF